MTFEAQPLSRALGAVISGIDLAQELPRGQIVELTQLLLEHQVLFFRDQPLTPVRSSIPTA